MDINNVKDNADHILILNDIIAGDDITASYMAKIQKVSYLPMSDVVQEMALDDRVSAHELISIMARSIALSMLKGSGIQGAISKNPIMVPVLKDIFLELVNREFQHCVDTFSKPTSELRADLNNVLGNKKTSA